MLFLRWTGISATALSLHSSSHSLFSQATKKQGRGQKFHNRSKEKKNNIFNKTTSHNYSSLAAPHQSSPCHCHDNDLLCPNPPLHLPLHPTRPSTVKHQRDSPLTEYHHQTFLWHAGELLGPHMSSSLLKATFLRFLHYDPARHCESNVNSNRRASISSRNSVNTQCQIEAKQQEFLPTWYINLKWFRDKICWMQMCEAWRLMLLISVQDMFSKEILNLKTA